MENYREKEFSILAAIQKGRKLPEWADNEQYLEPAEEWLLSAYFDLATCRGVDGAIPWRDMVEYADRAGLEPDVGRAFVRIMRIVDMERMDRSRSSETPEATTAPQPETAEPSRQLPTASKEAMRAAAQRRADNVRAVKKGQ